MAIETGKLSYTVKQIIDKLGRISVNDLTGNTEIGNDVNQDIDIYGKLNFYDEQGEHRYSLDAATLIAQKIHHGTADPNEVNPSNSRDGDLYVRYSTPT